MSTEPDGPWAEAMVRVRATDPRNGTPSWNRLGEMAGVSTTTITMMVNGRSRPSVATITKIADALRVSPDAVLSWLRGSGRSVTPYQVPDEVHLLTPRQQKALTEFIRAIAAEQTTGGEHGGDTAATITALGADQEHHDDYGLPEAARRPGKKSAGQAARDAQDDTPS